MSINFDKSFDQAEIQCDICSNVEEVDADQFMDVVAYKQDSDDWLSTKVNEDWYDVCSIGCYKKARTKAKGK